MAPKVLVINVDKGVPDQHDQPSKHLDLIIWQPASANDLVDIKFTGNSPFRFNRLTAPYAGVSIGAEVVVDPKKGDPPIKYEYTLLRKAAGIHNEPSIIVDTEHRISRKSKADESKGSKKKAGR